MRRTVLVALALTMAAVPVAEAKPKPKAVAGFTMVYGWANSAVDVTVPKGAKLFVPTPEPGRTAGFAELVNYSAGQKDTWMVVALISRSTRVAGRPVAAVQVHAPRPDHCPSDDAPTVEPPPPCRTFVEHVSVHGVSATEVAGGVQYALPAGTYQLIVSGPSRQLLAAYFQVDGLGGQRGFVTNKGVGAAFDRNRSEDLVLAHSEGYFGRKLSASGMAVIGVWHAAAADEPGEMTYAQCVTAGDPALANPDDCTPVAASGQAPPAGVDAKKPVFAAFDGGVTLDPAGTETFQTPILKKGTYFNTFRVTRGGRGPAAGTFAWWVIADSLK
ncbi:MAG TPA: hypothetical protein VNQ77_05970 [Frankiaceae bacterium]|nr:hypothetical protein [Frankiaceae bacterium]